MADRLGGGNEAARIPHMSRRRDGRMAVACRRAGGRPETAAWRRVSGGPVAAAVPRMEALLKGLREVGYGSPERLDLVLRTTDGDPTRIAPLVAEVVALNVDAIFAIGSVTVQAFRPATRTIPIIALDLETDPIGSGLIAGYARPGGNITGMFLDFPDFTKKWLELLKETIPQLFAYRRSMGPGHDPTSARCGRTRGQVAEPPVRRHRGAHPVRFRTSLRRGEPAGR